MFNNSSKILFIFILLMGTMITVSANSWFAAWMGLEINLLSFIPLMSDNNLMSTESSLKYFLIQALASMVLLFTSILMLINNWSIIQINSNFIFNMMLFSSLLLKSGTAPFHFWFPNVIEGLTWINSLILMTWQKLAPLMLISYLNVKNMLILAILLSSIIGALGGLNQTSLRKLMAYSSINHLSWMLSAMYLSESFWLLYFLFYSLLSMTLIILFQLFNVYHVNQLLSLFFYSKPMKFLLFTNLLSLGGLPPFIGFFPKWLIIQLLTSNNQIILVTIMVMMTLITLFFYLRLCYSSFMMNYDEMNWNNQMEIKMNKIFIYLLLSFISINGFYLIPMFYSMI